MNTSKDESSREAARPVSTVATSRASVYLPPKLRELWRYRELLWVLTLRGIQIRYKQSILGITWAVLQPVVLMLTFTLIFSVLLKTPSEGVPYPIFSYSGLLFWTFFTTSLNNAIPSLETNADLIRKVYFPREFLPMSAVFAAIFDLIIAAFIFLGMMFYYHISFTVNILYVIPVFIIQIVFTMGMGFIFSVLNAYYHDVRYALPLVIQVWTYVTPVIYPISMIPVRYERYYLLNPMAGIIESYRDALVLGTAPRGFYMLVAAVGAVFLFVVGYAYFKHIEMTFADVV